MITISAIKSVLERKIKNSDEFIVDVYIKPTNKIYIEIDSLKGVTIDKCVEYSKEIENNFDRNIEDYELQISSPGLDKPFKVKQQYEKNINKEIKIITFEDKDIKGILKNVFNNYIKIEVTNNIKGKHTETEDIDIEYSKIKTAKALIKF